MQRREFLRLASALPLVLLSPARALGAGGPDLSRVLVLLELNGGNDGLNTVIPYADRHYYELRPRLAVAREQVLQLTPELGLNPALEALMPAWTARELGIVLGVGYPDPNRSHFRSIEIWETGSDAQQTLTEGWIARAFADGTEARAAVQGCTGCGFADGTEARAAVQGCTGCGFADGTEARAAVQGCTGCGFANNPPPSSLAAHGVVFGRNEGPLAGARMRNLVIEQADQFLRQATQLRPAATSSSNPALAHLLAVQNDTRASASVLRDRLAQAPKLAAGFPGTRIGKQLEVAATLIAAQAPVAVIKVTHGSFDTHSNQRNQHDRLLRELAEALAAFRSALRDTGRWPQTLVMTYSEFGRRARENGSLGTDHGTAAPHVLLGGRVRGGLYGRQPSLTELADGDLRHHVDYRRLYATVARHWWGLRGDFLGGDSYAPLACLA